MIARSALALILVAGLAHAQTTFSVMVNGMTFQVDRYTPAGAGPFPIVALGHGFSNSKDNVRGLAQALQADGVVVVAPQLTGGLGINHSLNGDALVAAVDATVQAGIGDATRIAFGGHSAGGLAAWLAASRRAQTRALVLLDPVDNSNLGAAQTANVTAPTLFAFAPPQSCNTQNNSVAWFTGKTGLKGRFNVPMANHCDPQEPSNSLCLAGCGPTIITPATWNATRSAVYKRYARAFFGQFLLGNGSCVESMAATDAASGAINQVTMSLGSMCGADGGMGGGAAGGGSAAGGSAAGGSAAGGSAAGGSAAGGSAAGGSAAGGAAAGGSAAGGSAAGGSAAGGSAAGGSAAGGSAAGGAAAGGAAAGGSAFAGGMSSAGGTASGSCGPLNCTGCCNGLVCVQATDQTCGMNGGACAICSSAQMCEAGRCTSTPQPGCGCGSTSELGALVLVTLLGLTRRRR